jgi:hypothetical protein
MSRNAFRQLPRTSERDSVLGALGQLGKANLQQKVRHRAGIILKEIGAGFADLTVDHR